ncbi:hypothetical protein EV182_006622 [Spiromyces aspiralis]|uniref:Uncharacterized protein n=1 Tax=Spiromyces aspiralis TaxID=68401 RepID=A0ACC1H9U0_9FUNG|nr:hypothetical protein EV182_006622 [Spiromyces aspiralis]
MVVADLARMPDIKHALAKAAYAAGVRQVVDISSRLASLPWRSSYIGHAHRLGEERVLGIAGRGSFVAIRPSRFMISQLWLDLPGIKKSDTIFTTQDGDKDFEWISTDDIADVVTHVLTEPVEKHGDAVYELTGDNVSERARAALFSKALGRPVTFKQISPKVQYDQIVEHAKMPHLMAFDLVSSDSSKPPTTAVPVLLGRPYETLESWISKNKAAFQ